MKKGLHVFFAFLTIVITLTSCIKDTNSNTACKNKTVESEQAAILAYATANGITATAHSSGMYYQIMNPGSGATPTLTSKVFVTYTGKFTTDGRVFDSQTDPAKTGWVLGTLIEGWKLGMPLIQKGGSIKLIVPSSLAYGCSGFASIPPNAILYFEFVLVNVQ
jgi:FKBP-type peptidyl-prolyl cis-trans isomerase FkpA